MTCRLVDMGAAAVAVGVAMSLSAEPALAQRAAAASTATQWLARAREWLGGEARLAAVKALQIDRKAETLQIWFPDRYALITHADFGDMRTTFDGKILWSRFPEGMKPPAAINTAEGRAIGFRRIADYALTYLMQSRSPSPGAPRFVADRSCGRVVGLCIELFSGAEVFRQVVFNPATGQPLAVVALGGSASPGGPPEFDSITLLGDYRLVDGIRLPHLITRQRLDLQSGALTTLQSVAYDRVIVNPRFAAADFTPPAPAR